jgi:hypothetical protein
MRVTDLMVNPPMVIGWVSSAEVLTWVGATSSKSPAAATRTVSGIRAVALAWVGGAAVAVDHGIADRVDPGGAAGGIVGK